MKYIGKYKDVKDILNFGDYYCSYIETSCHSKYLSIFKANDTSGMVGFSTVDLVWVLMRDENTFEVRLDYDSLEYIFLPEEDIFELNAKELKEHVLMEII